MGDMRVGLLMVAYIWQWRGGLVYMAETGRGFNVYGREVGGVL